MDYEGKSLLAVEADQEGESVNLNRSDMDLLTACSSEMEGAVIIYDSDTQEGQVVKIITNQESKTETESVKSIDDFSDLITLHASSDVKNQATEEPINNELTDLKVEPSNKSEEPTEPEVDSDDDETIATFITSTGQQLALYAVEDSDEIFAVALYDESGEPPTNFHFLMKADVERLIGEGAVKTVKKPQVQQNKGTKPPEKREEIKFERYQDVKPTIQKVETPPPQVKKVEQIKTEMTEVPESKPQVALSKPKPSMEISKPKTQIEISKPRPQAEISKPRPQGEVSKPKPQMEASKVKSQMETSKVKSQMEASKPKVQVEVSKPTPQLEVSKPKPHVEMSKPKSQVEVSKPRPVLDTSRPKHHLELSKPRAQIEVPKPKTQIEVPKGKVEVSTPKFQMEVTKFKPQMEVRKFQFTKTQDIKSPKVEQPKTIITKNTPGIKKIFTPMKQSTPQVNRVVSNVSQPMMNLNKEAKNIAYVLTNESKSFITGDLNDEIDSDAEIIEQSTVQYILCDEDVSDEELTFDELQASLQSFNMSADKSKSFEIEKNEKKNDSILRYSPKKTQHKLAPILSQKKEVAATVYRTYKNPKKARTTNNLLQAHRKIKQEVEDPSYDFSSFDDGQFSSDDLPKESDKQATPPVKAKRSRKQQLTVVNRTDSEIIIQPASVFSEEEEEPVIVKKRGRRKKKLVPDPDYNPRKPVKKKTRSNRSVEVINIDIEEGELAAAMASGKNKGSSDKENDVISVGDSEEDEEEEEEEEEEEQATGDESPAPKRKKQSVMQCTHCLRNFRKRKALERHLPACPRSPAYLQKLEERKRQQASGKLIKRFKCKSCEETFDIAVALARHVRVTHSPRKRGRPAKNWSRPRAYDTSETEVEEEESSEESEPEPEPEPDRGSKRRGRPRAKGQSSREESFGQDFELKLDSSGEQLAVPRRRGRPPAKKIIAPKEKSPITDLEEKSETEQKKKGRRRKQSLSIERSITPEPDEDGDRPAEPRVQIPKKRGRPKQNLSKDGKSDTETEEKMDDSRKRGRSNKSIGSKEEPEKSREACIKVEVKLVPVEIPKKRRLSKDQTFNDNNESNSLDQNDEAPAKPIAEIPKKRRLSKEEPFLKDTESKVEKLAEPSADSEGNSTLKEKVRGTIEIQVKIETSESVQAEKSIEEVASEPQRSPMPEKVQSVKADTEASEKDIKVDENVKEVTEKDNKSSSEDIEASEKETKEEEKSEETTPEPRRSGRTPMKDKSSKEDIEASDEDTTAEEKTEETTSESRRSGRLPAKDKSSKEDIDASEEESKAQATMESPEQKKRGRPKEPCSASPEREEPVEASPESRKRGRPSKETASEVKAPETADTFESPYTESRKRGRPARDKTAKEDKQEADSSESESMEAQKRSRTAQSSPEAEAAEGQTASGSDKDKVVRKKLPSPNRTWKVKKLNCADCGKWFSSAAELGTHRLQHRTKKSGHRLQRCRVCRKLVPADTYAKHQAMAHGRAAAPVPTELRRRGRGRQVVAGAARRRRSLRSAN